MYSNFLRTFRGHILKDQKMKGFNLHSRILNPFYISILKYFDNKPNPSSVYKYKGNDT
jgi:hypothetical protein